MGGVEVVRKDVGEDGGVQGVGEGWRRIWGVEDDVGGVEIGIEEDVEWKRMGEWGSVEERGAIITTVINLCRQHMYLQASLFHRTERTGTDRNRPPHYFTERNGQYSVPQSYAAQ